MSNCKPSRIAPPPPVPGHRVQPASAVTAPDNNNKFNKNHYSQDVGLTIGGKTSTGLSAGRIPTVIRPKMVDTPVKKAPPRPPPPRMDYVPTRTTSLSKAAPAVPPQPVRKPPKERHRILPTKAFRKVKLFGGGQKSASTANANEEFYTCSSAGVIPVSAAQSDGGYANPAAAAASTRGAGGRASVKKQAPRPPVTGGQRTGVLIDLLADDDDNGGIKSAADSADASGGSVGLSQPFPLLLPPPGATGAASGGSRHHGTGRRACSNRQSATASTVGISNNVQSLLDMDFPEPATCNGSASLLDADNPPLVMMPPMATSLSTDHFGFDPFAPLTSSQQQQQAPPFGQHSSSYGNRKASLPPFVGLPHWTPAAPTAAAHPQVALQPRPASVFAALNGNAVAPPTTSSPPKKTTDKDSFRDSPPPPQGPAPQLSPALDSSTVHPNPCGMALVDNSKPEPRELAFSQYDLIELVAEHDNQYYLGRIDNLVGLVKKSALEVLTPLDGRHQDSDLECLQGDSCGAPVLERKRYSNQSNNLQNNLHCNDLRSPAGARQQQQRSSAVSTGGSLGTSAKPVASVPPLQAAETPAGVVDMLPCDVSANRIATTAAMAATAATSTPSEDVAGAVAVALFDFEAQHSDELGFAAGERLAIDGRYDHEWLLGHSLAKSDSHQGIFPASFVQILGCFENGSEAESFKKEDDARSKIEDQLDCSNREENNQRASNTLTSNKEDQLRTPVSNSNNQEHSQSLGRPAVALYTFSVEEKGDLAFKEGETVWVLSRINKDWLRGRNARGEEGQFPASFVHPEGPHDKSDDCGNTRHSKAVESVQESSLGDAAAAISPNIFVCLYDFEAEQKDDLTIHVGDKIQVTEKVSEEWWQGRVLGAEREGIFPATFVKSMSLG